MRVNMKRSRVTGRFLKTTRLKRNPTPYAEMSPLEREKDDLRLYRLRLKDVEAERKTFTGKKSLPSEDKYRRDLLDYEIKDLKAKIGRSERTIKSWFSGDVCD